MSTLWIASGNRKKRAELERLLQADASTRQLTLKTLADMDKPVVIREDAPDFAGNARKKAETLARAVQAPALGDDSGLCVDALDGRPGVQSARYGGAGLTDAERIRLLLAELAKVPGSDRTARFVCNLCLCGADGTVLFTCEETCEGFLLDAPRGDGGFGYDPIFVVAAHYTRFDALSFAQLDAAEKDALSHRGKALRRLVTYLHEHPLPQPPSSP